MSRVGTRSVATNATDIPTARLSSIESRQHAFTFDVQEVQINYPGNHYIKLTARSSASLDHERQYTAVLLNTDARPSEFVKAFSVKTEKLNVGDAASWIPLRVHRFTFILPWGFWCCGGCSGGGCWGCGQPYISRIRPPPLHI